jgi:hypothetical protein
MVSDQREGTGHPLKQMTAKRRLLLGDYPYIIWLSDVFCLRIAHTATGCFSARGWISPESSHILSNYP